MTNHSVHFQASRRNRGGDPHAVGSFLISGEAAMLSTSTTPAVFVVDDDVSVRESLDVLIRSAGWQAETFASAHDFLARPRALVPNCLVLDVSLPDLDGLELQRRVAAER